MYNNFNQNNDANENKMKGQQFPGGFRIPPEFPGSDDMRRPSNQPPQFPGMEAQPRSAPPNFIPEGPSMDRPGMDRRQMDGPGMDRRGPGQGQVEFGAPYRGGDWQVRPREIRRCMNRFTYIWLVNGNAFWFYPTFVGGQFVQGFRWRRNRWEYERINLRRIFFFRCF